MSREIAEKTEYQRLRAEAQTQACIDERRREYGHVMPEVMRAEQIVLRHHVEMLQAEERLIEMELQRRELEWLPAVEALGGFLRGSALTGVLGAIEVFCRAGGGGEKKP